MVPLKLLHKALPYLGIIVYSVVASLLKIQDYPADVISRVRETFVNKYWCVKNKNKNDYNLAFTKFIIGFQLNACIVSARK